ncbi:MAG: hypothetical protein KGL10_03145 [Alphaproteobacteria bacterium]|nr:hypothetical protein [Alphaproteobacteria bacterium]
MFFGKKRSEKGATDYYTLGRDGTLMEFEIAFAELKARRDPRKGIDRLLDGIGAAFHLGRPESLQAVLAEPERFSYKYCPYSLDVDYKKKVEINVAQELFNLLQDAAAPAAAVKLALALLPKDKQQNLLDATLYKAVAEFSKTEIFAGALLGAGADPNAAADGRRAGCITARAVARDLPAATLKLLHDHGADFDLALAYMAENNWGESLRDRLESYRAKTAGKKEEKPAAQNDELLIQLAETVLELTQRVAALEAELGENPRGGTPARRTRAAGKKRPNP